MIPLTYEEYFKNSMLSDSSDNPIRKLFENNGILLSRICNISSIKIGKKSAYLLTEEIDLEEYDGRKYYIVPEGDNQRTQFNVYPFMMARLVGE